MSYKLLSSKEVQTKKPHECWGCSRTFPENSKLTSESWLWDGEFIHGYFCNTCKKVRGIIIDNYDLDGYSEGSLPEYDEWHEVEEVTQ